MSATKLKDLLEARDRVDQMLIAASKRNDLTRKEAIELTKRLEQRIKEETMSERFKCVRKFRSN